jgi:hypothetical protein
MRAEVYTRVYGRSRMTPGLYEATAAQDLGQISRSEGIQRGSALGKEAYNQCRNIAALRNPAVTAQRHGQHNRTPRAVLGGTEYRRRGRLKEVNHTIPGPHGAETLL